MRTGVDVSHHNSDAPKSPIDWAAVRAAGHDFAIIKASEGRDFRDSAFRTNFDRARAEGFIVAPYHYLKPRWDNESQLDNFRFALDGRKPDFVMLDCEEDDNRGSPEVRDDIWHLLTGLGEYNVPVIAYTASWWWTPRVGDHILLKDFNGQPNPTANWWRLQVADWGSNNGQPHPGEPFLPEGWRSGDDGNGPFEGEWSIWQYTSKGTCPGIVGNVDLNLITDEFWNELAVTVPPPPVPTDLEARVKALEDWASSYPTFT